MCTLFFVLVLRRNHVRRSWKIQRARYTLPRFGLIAKCRGCLKISEQVGGNPITLKEELGDIREPSQMRSEFLHYARRSALALGAESFRPLQKFQTARESVQVIDQPYEEV